MKNLILLLLVLPFVGLSQEIPKKADIIVISNDKSASENFILVKQTLSDNGIEISSQDRDVFQIKGGPIAASKNAVTSFYLFKCKDNSIVMTGKFKSGIELNLGGTTATDELDVISNRGMSGSMYKRSFNSMNDFAKKLGNNVAYKSSKDK